MSPAPTSRSPSGPTYTQLGSSTVPRGMWCQWQGSSGTTDGQPPNIPVTSAGQPTGPSASVHPGPHPPQQELSDMLQILNQSEQASFEDLSMFNSFTE